MDILTMKSKIKLDCNLCEKCCIYRGDIRLTPVNVCAISKYLKISISEFIEKYTDRLNTLELVLKTKGKLKQCILYDDINKKCGIHVVEPMQCLMFPLVPENLKRNYFVNSGECVLKTNKEITVNKWLNGNKNNFNKNKKICMEWISFLDEIEEKINNLPKEKIDEIFNLLFYNYDLNKNYKKQLRKNIKKILEGE